MMTLSMLIYRMVFTMIATSLSITSILELAVKCSTTDEFGTSFGDNCIEKCNITGRRIDCIDCIPNDVTPTVNEIVVLDFNGSHFVPHMFCGVTWPHVNVLTIANENLVTPKYDIDNFTFDCLPGIETLRLKLPWLVSFNQKSLFGLENVRILDLTTCIRLEISGLTPALSLDASVPMLQRLILGYMGSAVDGIQLSQGIIDNLAHRKIKNIDISSTTVAFGNPPVKLDLICECLETLNMANSRIIHSKILHISPCYSLRVLNLSGVKFPRAIYPSGNITVPPMVRKFHPIWFPFISAISVIYLNNIISPDHYIFFNNVTLYFPLNNSLSEIHLSGYNIPVFELKFRLDSNHVTYIDISNNKIEHLGSDSLVYLEHLNIIDLSSNKLAVSKQFEETFSTVFRTNSKLEIVMLSNNGLSYLPSQVFELNTELKQIDLSRNKITQISFKISHLHKLVVLNLRGNLVQYLNGWSRHQIDMLYKHKQEKRNRTGEKSFTLDLRDNVFSCRCQSLKFIKWFVHSPVFAGHRDSYSCELNDKHIPMNADAIGAAQDDCDKPARKVRKLLIIVLLTCVSTASLVGFAIVAFKRYKRKRLYRRLREHIDLIHEDQLGYRFPVFLSYASEDSGFVEPNILQPLETQLKNLTNCERSLVAIGDRYFRLGRSIFAEIIRMLEDCAVFVVVLSKNYCNSDYSKHEIEQARLMRKPIVIIMKEFVDEGDMNGVIRETFKHYTRATFRFEEGDLRLKQDWEYICQSIIQLL